MTTVEHDPGEKSRIHKPHAPGQNPAMPLTYGEAVNKLIGQSPAGVSTMDDGSQGGQLGDENDSPTYQDGTGAR